MTPVAYLAIDQGGNIIEGNGIAATESITVEQGVKPATSEGKLMPSPERGLYIDVQSTKSTDPLTVIKQKVFVGQFPPVANTRATHLFRVGPNEITKDAKAGTISIKIGPTSKVW